MPNKAKKPNKKRKNKIKKISIARGKQRTPKPKRRQTNGAKPPSAINKTIKKIKIAKLKDSIMFNVPHYPQTEDFTSSAACAMMVLKHNDDSYKMKKNNEFEIWQEAVQGSVWYGSKYGLAYALAKRGLEVTIISNVKDEGYERRLAVYENVNLDSLSASFNEVREKSRNLNVHEELGNISLQTVKKTLSSNHLPIILIDAKAINPYIESRPHWVIVKGYDKDNFYINDPYSDSTITVDPDIFRQALGFDSNYHMIIASASKRGGNRQNGQHVQKEE